MKKIKMNFLMRLPNVVAALCGVLLLASCNQNIEESPRREYQDKTSSVNDNHVLWVIINGASGSAIKQANNDKRATTLREMMKSAMYTYDGLADTRSDTLVTMSVGMDNMLNGKTTRTSDTGTPTILSLLNQSSSQMKTAVFATTQYFYDKVSADATVSQKGTDAEMTAAAKEYFSGDDLAKFVLVEYNGVNEAGEAHGFVQDSGDEKGSATNEVVTAISTVDGYIKQLKETLAKRPNYSSENWLIVVTSTYGGSTEHSDSNPFQMKDRNVYTMFYNSKFSADMLQAPSSEDGVKYSYNSPVFGNKAVASASVKDPSLFDFPVTNEKGDTMAYTIQFMFRSLNKKNTDVLVSKALKATPGKQQGWQLMCDGNGIRSYLAGQSNRSDGKTICDGKWHVVTMIANYKETTTKTKVRIYMYRDGVSTGYGNRPYCDCSNNIDVGDKAPLTIGKIYGAKTGSAQFCITNLQVYDIALPASYIAENYKLTGLDDRKDELPYWDHLIGYWPLDREDDYKNNTILDYSKYGSVFGGVNAGKSDMTLDMQGNGDNTVWTAGSSTEENVLPPYNTDYYQSVINLVDVPYQTLQWLGVIVPSTWGWTGIARSLPYADLQ